MRMSEPRRRDRNSGSELSKGGAHPDGENATNVRDRPRWGALLLVVLLVIAWYTVNILLVLANKWLISRTGFNSTTTLTLFHMVTTTLLAYALVYGGLYPDKAMNRALLGKVTILAASFTISVAACMASLNYLPASFVQAMGSTTPVFTALLAFTIQGRREAGVTYCSLLPVVGGIVLASGGEPLFSFIGLALQLVSCFSRSFKTVLQAVLLMDEKDRFHPMALLGHTSAISSLLLVPLVLMVEPGALRQARELHAKDAAFLPLLLLSCALAFLVNLTNFLVTKQLGALTLQVLGNFKNVVAAVVSVFVFLNPVTPMGITGYGITTVGVFVYSHLVRTYPATVVGGALGGAGAAGRRGTGSGDVESSGGREGVEGRGAEHGEGMREPLLRAMAS